LGSRDVPSRLHLKRQVVRGLRHRLRSASPRCLNWPRGADSAGPKHPETSHAHRLTTHRSPPHLTTASPPPAITPTVWTRLPAERQRQLRDPLGQLLARLLAATRGGGAGHE
jgi:hypothetical protein